MTVLNVVVTLVIALRAKSKGWPRAVSFDAPWKDGVAMIGKLGFAAYPTDVTSGKQ